MKQKDTTDDARKVLVQIYRRMSVEAKTRRIFDAYRTGRILAIAGLKESHPHATDKQIWYLWAKRHLGEELFNNAYGKLSNE
ncbi:MAG: hypothetical protein JXB29_05635 [Sedimentisphaerales bacterium]|nr:hypothetical protein [Sedimentisphaerales bacterium]